MGTVLFPIEEFKNENLYKRPYYKSFAGKTIPVLHWRLKVHNFHLIYSNF